MKAVYRNELSTYFTTFTGYVFCAFILLFAGIYTMAMCLKQGYVEFEYVLGNMAFVFFIIVPIITMRTLAEERKQKTDQLLYALPISTTNVILGKYFALLTILLIPVVIICFYPLVLSLYGSIYLPASYGAIIGFFFMGAAFLSIGLFISSITESQMLAAGVCFAVLLVNYFIADLADLVNKSASVSFFCCLFIAALFILVIYLMTKNVYISGVIGVLLLALVSGLYFAKSEIYEGLIPSVMSKLSIFEHYYTFMDETFNLTDIVFFLSVSAIFVFLTVQSMEKRRWS